jgi:Ca2+-binding RTX toxin-like protein
MTTIDFQGTTYKLESGTGLADIISIVWYSDSWTFDISTNGSDKEIRSDPTVPMYVSAGAGDDFITASGYAGHPSLVLDGGAGADVMRGDGDTIFIVDDPGDIVIATAGYKSTVYSSVSYALPDNANTVYLIGTDDLSALGNSAPNTIVGNSGNNSLDGGFGPDSLTGGLGDDAYIVDNPGDQVIEKAGEGTDLVETTTTYTLPDHVENITILQGQNSDATGNDLDNTIIGNTGDNVLDGGAGRDQLYGELGQDHLSGGDGNDLLDGGTGADTMAGGTGNDLYYVENGLDQVIEAADGGYDTVFTSVAMDVPDNVERLVFNGTSDGVVLSGSALADFLQGNDYINVLLGGDGNDTLDGGPGADDMEGGAGNDTYIVDNTNDAVVESIGGGGGGSALGAAAHHVGGVDLIETYVDYTLSANVENGRVLNPGGVDLTGNELANRLVGNFGNDRLVGGIGKDTLTGGTGADRFEFDSVADSHGTRADKILDFSHHGGDSIDVSNIDADNHASGDQAFAFIGTAEFSGTAGELRCVIGLHHTVIFGDVNGDGIADLKIILHSAIDLAAADFVL